MTRPNQAFFSADDEEHGYELFITDGSETGTTLVKDIAEGYWELGVEESNPCLLTPYQENLYFAANTGQLWRSDGTESGTFEVPLPDLDPFWTEILEIGVVGDYLYIIVNDYGDLLFLSDGTSAGTSLVATGLFPQTHDGSYFVQDSDGILYFAGECNGEGRGSHLCKLTLGDGPLNGASSSNGFSSGNGYSFSSASPCVCPVINITIAILLLVSIGMTW